MAASAPPRLREAEREQLARNSRELIDGAQRNDAAAVRRLLRAGMQPDTADAFGETALRWAATRAHDEVARVLLAHGARPDQADRAGWTPLMWAASYMYSQSAVLRQLLECGASPTGTSHAGKTPLELAKLKGKARAAALLEAARRRRCLWISWRCNRSHRR